MKRNNPIQHHSANARIHVGVGIFGMLTVLTGSMLPPGVSGLFS